MSLRVEAYTPEVQPAWNDFNAEARNGHFLFDRRFMDYHSDRFSDASCLVRDENDALLGLFPANRVGDRIYSHQGLTFGGIVLGAARLPRVLCALDAVADWYRGKGARCIVYKPLPHIYHRRPSQDDLYWLARNGARLVRRDVSSSIDCIVPGPISARRKRGADKAVKAGLRFESSDRWVDFWAVLHATLTERHGVQPVHTADEIQRLAGALPSHIRLHLALRAQDILAGVVTFTNGRVIHAQYIAASPEGRSLGALDGLFRHLIDAECENGTGIFDFGISTEDQGRVLNEGLVTQKEEFGASATVYDIYELSL